MQIPLVCETPDCPHFGQVIDVISGIAPENLDMVYEDYGSDDDANFCPLCHCLAVAQDPEDEDTDVRP